METIKMKSIVLACIIVTSSFLCVSVFVRPGTANLNPPLFQLPQPGNETKEPHGSISVTGSAEQQCKPELLCIYLKIVTLDPTSAVTARDEAARIIDKVLQALKALGLTESDIETESYNIAPKYVWEGNTNVFKGNEVTVSMKVTLKNFDKAGVVIDASVDAGALIDRISFELTKEKQNQMKLQVMADAARDAKNKAEAVINALGEELGYVTSVSIDNYGYNPYVYWHSVTDSAGDMYKAAPPTSILPSDLTVSATVNVVFAIL
jgi:uncharacterized protein YggE